MASWLEELKPGDTIIETNGNGTTLLRKMKRRTPTQIISTSGARYRAKDGEEIGAFDLHPFRLEEPTPERLQEIRLEAERRKLTQYLKCQPWEKLPLETVRQVVAIVEVCSKEKEERNSPSV